MEIICGVPGPSVILWCPVSRGWKGKGLNATHFASFPCSPPQNKQRNSWFGEHGRTECEQRGGITVQKRRWKSNCLIENPKQRRQQGQPWLEGIRGSLIHAANVLISCANVMFILSRMDYNIHCRTERKKWIVSVELCRKHSCRPIKPWEVA